jgi:hypothetical protein
MDEIPPQLHLGDFSGVISVSRQWNESKKSQNKLCQSISGNNVGLFDAKLVHRKCAGNIGPLSNNGSTIDQHPLFGPAGAINPPSVRICDCFGSRGTELIWAKSARVRTHGTAALG